MKNVWEVLHQKEAELHRVRLEIAALHLVGPLLAEPKLLEGPKKPTICRRLLLAMARGRRRHLEGNGVKEGGLR